MAAIPPLQGGRRDQRSLASLYQYFGWTKHRQPVTVQIG
jgi:hypothetical protein